MTKKEMIALLTDIRAGVKRIDTPANRMNMQRFFKEKLKEPITIRTAVMRKLSNEFFKQVKHLPKKDILDFCDFILATDFRFRRFFAFEWAGKLHTQYEKGDFKRFEFWLKTYVDNWGVHDHLAQSFGYLLFDYPELLPKVKSFAKSKNMWLRRMSAVALIYPVRKGKYLDDIFTTADILLRDEEDLVQKGYGWTLKEAGNVYPDEVFAYVMRNKKDMPRTALRYAIEKYPLDMRKKAMKKDW